MIWCWLEVYFVLVTYWLSKQVEIKCFFKLLEKYQEKL